MKTTSAVLASLLLASGAGAQEFTKPKAWLITPFTGFPDVVALSVIRPIGDRFSFEHGASLVIPAIFVRVGRNTPLLRTEVREVSFAILGGGRTALIPVEGGGVVAGPTLEIGVLSFPLTDSELLMYLTVGAWVAWNVSDGPHTSNREPGILPSVRLEFGRP